MHAVSQGGRRYGWWLYYLLLWTVALAQCLRKIMQDSGGVGARYGPLLAALALSLLVYRLHQGRPLAWRWSWLALLGLLLVIQLSIWGLLWVALTLSWPTLSWVLLLMLSLLPLPAIVLLWRRVAGAG